jgi:hypothetical protein
MGSDYFGDGNEMSRYTFKLALLAALGLFGFLAAARAQSADPFAGLHERLLLAAERQIELAKSKSPEAAQVASPKSAEQPQAETASANDPALKRVNSARLKLSRFGVDAIQIFLEEGVPLELLAVAEVESAFNPQALSPKGARGIWQFMPATAERFGLRVNSELDERTSPSRSTRAAARYLRVLFTRFGNWQLALAAYNAGEGRVDAAIERGGTRDFRRLVELRLLPEETRRYVPAVLTRKGN